MGVNESIKKVGVSIVISFALISVSGCSALITKAEKNSEERAQKFSDEELCQHLREDGNMYYSKANNQEVEHRKLKCD